MHRPKIKWISCQNGNFPPNAIKGGRQHGVDLFIIRAPHMGSTTPGKLYEFAPPGVHPGGSKATLAWGGGERHKFSYEVGQCVLFIVFYIVMILGL